MSATLSTIAAIVGRIFLSLIFIAGGVTKLIDIPGTQAYIESVGTLPPGVALPTAIFELVAGIMLAIGLMTRLVAIVLAGFTIATILFFHADLTDQVQSAMAMKNLAIAGGLMVVFAYGQMRGSYDHMRTVRKGEVVATKAGERAHDAELRAAHAEGLAEGLTKGRAENGARPVGDIRN